MHATSTNFRNVFVTSPCVDSSSSGKATINRTSVATAGGVLFGRCSIGSPWPGQLRRRQCSSRPISSGRAVGWQARSIRPMGGLGRRRHGSARCWHYRPHKPAWHGHADARARAGCATWNPATRNRCSIGQRDLCSGSLPLGTVPAARGDFRLHLCRVPPVSYHSASFLNPR